MTDARAALAQALGEHLERRAPRVPDDDQLDEARASLVHLDGQVVGLVSSGLEPGPDGAPAPDALRVGHRVDERLGALPPSDAADRLRAWKAALDELLRLAAEVLAAA